MATWKILPNAYFSITEPTHSHIKCTICILIDVDSMTPEKANIAFYPCNFTDDWRVPIHISITDPITNTSRYLRVSESYSATNPPPTHKLTTNDLKGLTTDPYIDDDAPSHTGYVIDEWLTKDDGDWWKCRFESINKAPIVITKDPLTNDWQIPAFKLCTDYNAINLSSFNTCETNVHTQVVITIGTVEYQTFEKFVARAAQALGVSNNVESVKNGFKALSSQGKTSVFIYKYLNGDYGNITYIDEPYYDEGVLATIKEQITDKVKNINFIWEHPGSQGSSWSLAEEFITPPIVLFTDRWPGPSGYDAIAAQLTVNPTWNIQDLGNHTYKFSISNTPVSAGDARTYHPLEHEKVTCYKDGDITKEILVYEKSFDKKTFGISATYDPSKVSRTIGPYTESWKINSPAIAGSNTKINYYVKGYYDTDYTKVSRSFYVKNYQAPSQPNIDNSFYYFSRAVPRPSGSLSFTWQEATQTNSNSPVIGYRIAVYTRTPQQAANGENFHRIEDLACKWYAKDFRNESPYNCMLLEYAIFYLRLNDPLPQNIPASVTWPKYFRATKIGDKNGFIFTDQIESSYKTWNQPLPNAHGGKHFRPGDAKSTQISFLNDYYIEESSTDTSRTWRGITLDLSTFPEDLFPVGTEIRLRVCACTKNGAGDYLVSKVNETTEGTEVGTATIMKPVATLRPKVSDSWKESEAVYVKVDGSWKEAESIYVKTADGWKEAE